MLGINREGKIVTTDNEIEPGTDLGIKPNNL